MSSLIYVPPSPMTQCYTARKRGIFSAVDNDEVEYSKNFHQNSFHQEPHFVGSFGHLLVFVSCLFLLGKHVALEDFGQK